MTLVSIIVPVYNVEDYIERCIHSLINQTYLNIEILLIDDGSTDTSGKICDIYANQYESISVFHKINGGLSSARNEGISRSHGDFLAFVDSDDYIDEKFIEKLVTLANQYNCEVVECKYKHFANKKVENAKHCDDVRLLSGSQMALRLYSEEYVNAVITCNKIYKKVLFQDTLFPLGKLYEDEGTTYKLMYNAKQCLLLDDELYFYYKREGSITNSKFNKRRFEYLEILKERAAFFSQKDELLYLLTIKRYFYDGLAMLSEAKKNGYNDVSTFRSIKAEMKSVYRIIQKSSNISKKTRMIMKFFYYFPFLFNLYINRIKK